MANTFRLRDLDDPDASLSNFCFLVQLIAWSTRQRKLADFNHDQVIARKDGEDVSFNRSALYLHLAMHDPEIFEYSKRVSAKGLLGDGPVSKLDRLIAAELLMTKKPKRRSNQATAHSLVVMAIAVRQLQGCAPLGKNGGADQLQNTLAMDYGISWHRDKIHKIWRERREKLIALGFDEKSVSAFFDRVCPKTE